jgi:DNA-binding FrmR family transcriptional regulator
MKKPHKTTHEENLVRLARIEGQVRGIQRMVNEGAYCIDILTQIQAVQSALKAVGRKILHKHMEHCVADAFKNPSEEDVEAKMQELLELMKKSCG